MGHSLFAPSAAHRWVECAASLKECAAYPETTSEYAEEGQRAHALAERIFDGLSIPPDTDPEMIGYVTEYCNTVKSMTHGADARGKEQWVDISDVIGIANQGGTLDYYAIVGDELQIHDLKYGKGVKVFAEKNYQLILYAGGILAKLRPEMQRKIQKVRLVIHQPRLQHCDEVVYTVEETEDFCVQIAKKAHLASYTYNRGYTTPDDYTPGKKQCTFCLHRGKCEALAKYLLTEIVGEFDNLDEVEGKLKACKDNVREADGDYFSKVYGILDLLTSFVSAFKEQAMARMLSGVGIEGYKLVAGRAGARKWGSEETAEAAMKAMRLKMDQMYDMSLISPAGAEKLLKANKRKWSKLEPLIVRSDPAPTIAPVGDKRPAISVDVKKDFEDLTGNDLL